MATKIWKTIIAKNAMLRSRFADSQVRACHRRRNPRHRTATEDINDVLVAARARLSEIEAGAATIKGVAAREGCSKRHVNMTISLSFLAPSLVKAAVEGQLPHGIGVARLFDAPVAWLRQHQMLGLAH